MKTKLYVVIGVWRGVVDHVSVYFSKRSAVARAELLWQEYRDDLMNCDIVVREVEIDLNDLQAWMGTSG